MTDRTFGILWRGAACGLGTWAIANTGAGTFPMTGAEYIDAVPAVGGFMFIGIIIFSLGADYGEQVQIDERRKWEEAQEQERIIAAAILGEEVGKGPEPEVATAVEPPVAEVVPWYETIEKPKGVNIYLWRSVTDGHGIGPEEPVAEVVSWWDPTTWTVVLAERATWFLGVRRNPADAEEPVAGDKKPKAYTPPRYPPPPAQRRVYKPRRQGPQRYPPPASRRR